MERLRKQMKKLCSSDRPLSRSEVKAGVLEQQPAMTKKRVRRLEEEKQAAETRAEQAEKRVSVHSWKHSYLSTLTFINPL